MTAPFSLVFQHNDFVIIDKYPGISVHKDDNETAFVNDVACALGKEKLYLVHRLDKMTSGLLILACSSEAAALLCGLFASKDIEKYYLALSAKKPKKKQGLVAGDMEKARRGAWKLTNGKTNPAVTQFFSTAYTGNNGEAFRALLCKPHTGKTHQIRVAMKSVGAPLLGDELYGGEASDRGYLHAYALRFHYKGENFSFVLSPQMGEHWYGREIEGWAVPWDLSWPVVKKN
ncbi:TIGR01621 family pseudouridine synthase [Parasalinivibrio latis]|uniref:TIGR01621 family pseudouridine synthase n=1 Tax=Parasalinivibrio latis TaxID=2952610 RepID=UPI0030E4046B